MTQGDLLRALEKDSTGRTTLGGASDRKPIVAYPDELVIEALFRMLQSDIGRLPVVSRENPDMMVGYLNRTTILSAWTRQLHEENHRDLGWLRNFYVRKTPVSG